LQLLLAVHLPSRVTGSLIGDKPMFAQRGGTLVALLPALPIRCNRRTTNRKHD